MLLTINRKILTLLLAVLILFVIPFTTFSDTRTVNFNGRNINFIQYENGPVNQNDLYYVEGADLSNDSTALYSINTSTQAGQGGATIQTTATPSQTLDGRRVERFSYGDGDRTSEEFFFVPSLTEPGAYNRLNQTQDSYGNQFETTSNFNIEEARGQKYVVRVETADGNSISNSSATDPEFNALSAFAASLKEELGERFTSLLKCDNSIGNFNPLCQIAVYAYRLILIPSANFLTTSGLIFDTVVSYTIVNMSANLGLNVNNGQGSAINEGWILFRDITNIMFIFVLLYISIDTIRNGTGATGKQIATVIAVAVLINFSLFFTKAFIDVTNNVALSLYNSAVESSNVESSTTRFIYYKTGLEKSLAGVFIAKSGVASIFKAPDGHIDHSYMILQAFGGAAIMIILAIILLLASFMFATRFIILAIVMITSSLAFGAYMLPTLKKSISDKWWQSLFGQALMAPIFFVFMFVAIKLLDSSLFLNETIDFSDLSRPKSTELILYGLVIGLLFAAIILSKQFADKTGAESSKITKLLGGAAIGSAAFAGRQLGGRAGRLLRDSKIANGNNMISRGIKRGANAAASSSFDLRNVKTVKNVAAKAGVDVGEAGGKGGYEKTVKEAKERLKNNKKLYEQKTKAEQRAIITLKKNMDKAARKINEDISRRQELIKNSNNESFIQQQKQKIRELETERGELRVKTGKFSDPIKYKDAEDRVKSINKKAKSRGQNYVNSSYTDAITSAQQEFAEEELAKQAEKDIKEANESDEDRERKKLAKEIEKARKENEKKDGGDSGAEKKGDN